MNMFKTILNNLITIYKPKIPSSVVKVTIYRRPADKRIMEQEANICNAISWHIFNLPGREEIMSIDGTNIRAEIL